MFDRMLENLRRRAPLIHSITNYVTVNDCANILLACGASPIMSDDPGEVEEITALCGGLTLNLGTLNQRTVPAMTKAGKQANRLGRPVILDPVGAGASRLRTETARRLLEDISFTAIRGNISEIKALASGQGGAKGVDADLADRVTEENLDRAVTFAKAFSEKTGAVVAMTGAIDVVADRERAFCIRNGHPFMTRVTGAGCMLSVMTAAYEAANPEEPLLAAAAAAAAMGICGELAWARLGPAGGNASYRTYLLDAVCNLTPEALEKGAKYEMR